MDKLTRQFLTDAVKPWDELNTLLSKPLAFQPDVSDITRSANTIAVALKHTAELSGATRRKTDQASFGNNLMSDVADAWKHGGNRLDDPARHNSMAVLSRFEFDSEKGFRFLRNRILINHATFGARDFMEYAGEAIRYWLIKLAPDIVWPGNLFVCPPLFHPVAILFYDPSKQIGMDSVRLETVKRTASGSVAVADCTEVRFALLDFSDGSFSQIGDPIASDEQ